MGTPLSTEEVRRRFELSKKLGEFLTRLANGETVASDDNTITDADRVAIHRLRVKLEDYGIEIVARRKLGYWMEEKHQGTIRTLVRGDEDGTDRQ